MELTDKPTIHWFSAEMLVAYQFCKQGYVVGVPLSPCQYDLIIDTKDGGIQRIQVKKGRFVAQRERPQGLGDRAHWEVMLTNKRGNGNGKKTHRRISDEAFDYLAVVCYEDAIYIIPNKKLKSEDAGKLMRLFHIKPPIEGEGRADSKKAGLRWESYRNNFKLEESNVKTQK